MIEVIRPAIFSSHSSGIKAFFTLKNEALAPAEALTAGLNLGYNTADPDAVVEENRQQMIALEALDPDWVAYGEQVHGSKVTPVYTGGTFSATDALVTTIPGLTLAIQVADCAAVLLADTTHGVIGAAHAGWRGAVAEIVPETIAQMESLGARADACLAFISPCLSQAVFEVGAEVADQFPDNYIDDRSYAKPHVDLKRYIAGQLHRCGLPESSVEVDPGCTLSEERFFSYRREGDRSGRMMACIQITEAV